MTQFRRGTTATVFALLLIALYTLIPVLGAPRAPFDWCVICGTFGASNLLLNIGLFVPLGMALRRRGLDLWMAFLAVLLLTISIELLQLTFIVGRFSTLGDILSNASGGALGWLLASSWRKLLRPDRALANRLQGICAAAMLLLSAASLWLFTLSPTDLPYHGQVAPDLARHDRLPGVVTNPMINGVLIRSARMVPLDRDSARQGMLNGRAILTADLLMVGRAQRDAPVIRVVDTEREEMAGVYVRGVDVIFSARTRAADLSLRQPQLRLRNALACDSCANGVSDVRSQITAGRTGNRYRIGIAGPQAELRDSLLVTPNLAWIAIAPDEVSSPGSVVMLSVLFLAVQYALISYWNTWAAPSAAGPRRAIVVAVMIALLTQFGVPLAMGAGNARGSVAEWIGIACGVITGTVAAHMLRARVSR